MDQNEIDGIVRKVRARLETLSANRRVDLALEDRDYREEDELLYLNVISKRAGIRPSDYAELMAQIEKELRGEHIDNVLLVPAVPE